MTEEATATPPDLIERRSYSTDEQVNSNTLQSVQSEFLRKKVKWARFTIVNPDDHSKREFVCEGWLKRPELEPPPPKV